MECAGHSGVNDVIVECVGHSGVVMSYMMSGWFQDLPQFRPYKLGLLGAGLVSYCAVLYHTVGKRRKTIT